MLKTLLNAVIPSAGSTLLTALSDSRREAGNLAWS
jgi:hypothetical protein